MKLLVSSHAAVRLYTHQISCPSIDVQSFDSIKFCHIKELQKHQNPKPSQKLRCTLLLKKKPRCTLPSHRRGSSSKYQIHKVNDPVIECTVDLEAFLQHLSSSCVVISINDANKQC